MKTITTNALLFISATYLMAACSLQIKPSEESKQVTIYHTSNELPGGCISLKGKLIGLGSTEREAQYDLAHQARTDYNADSVVITHKESFTQTSRLSNYLRTPILKAPKATKNYYYKDGFTKKVIGNALSCSLLKPRQQT